MRSWSLADMPCQAGHIALVTGANTGLGFQTARMLALHGADDVLACRNSGKGEIAVERIRAERPTARVSLIELDLADLDSVAACARAFVNTYGRLDLLINNAGVMVPPFSRTRQGFELQFGTNHLGHFALACRLMPPSRKDDGKQACRRVERRGNFGQVVFATAVF